MKPFDHAELSAKKFGGIYEDYIEIHKWFDQFRYSVANPLHRMFLHNSVGIMICEQVFGDFIENSNKKKIAVRDIAEHHILLDVGEIRTPQDWLENMHNPDYVKPYKAKLDSVVKDLEEKDTGKTIDTLKKKIDDLTKKGDIKIYPFLPEGEDNPFAPFDPFKKQNPWQSPMVCD